MISNKANYLSFSIDQLSELMSSSRNGNSRSFEKLSIMVKDISYSYFLSKHHAGRIPFKEDVEDLTNNVYLSFAEQYQSINDLEKWLRRVLFLSFINWYKKDKVQKKSHFDENIHNDRIIPDMEINLDSEKILVIINELPDEKKQIIKMRFWRDMKFADIALELNKTEMAVKKMFYRTIDELKGKL